MQKTDKEKTLRELKEKLSQTKSLFLTDFRGLNVGEMTNLRRGLKDKRAEYKITKNTLIRRAIEGSGFGSIGDFLKGPTGLVFSYEDPVAPAKALYELFKKLEKPKIKVIWMDGKVFNQSQLKTLASLPVKEVLLAEVFSALNSPLVNLVSTLQGVPRELVMTVEAIMNKKSKAA
jgi:large subunit ribosomal protein L10